MTDECEICRCDHAELYGGTDQHGPNLELSPDDWKMEICSDCLYLIANGDAPEHMSEDEADAYALSIEEDGRTIVPLSCPDIEFSWSWCDACRRSNQAGTRHRALSMVIR